MRTDSLGRDHVSIHLNLFACLFRFAAISLITSNSQSIPWQLGTHYISKQFELCLEICKSVSMSGKNMLECLGKQKTTIVQIKVIS